MLCLSVCEASCGGRSRTWRVRVAEFPETRYAEHGESSIAYQVLGRGPVDIVFMRSAFAAAEVGDEGRLAVRRERALNTVPLQGRGADCARAVRRLTSADRWAHNATSSSCPGSKAMVGPARGRSGSARVSLAIANASTRSVLPRRRRCRPCAVRRTLTSRTSRPHRANATLS